MARTFINRQPDYSDLDLDFFRNPTSGDVSIKTGEEAVKRSIRNLIMTNFYDRPFRSYIGSGVRSMLFENDSTFTTDQLQSAIREVINNFEPRAAVVDVTVTGDSDRNGYDVRLTYVIKNREQPIVTSIFLERIR